MTDGPKDWRWNPDLLWQQTRLGREEYVQRLLAALILGAPTTRWNKPEEPTPRGAEFLRRLHARSFADTPSDDPIFIDEFELPSRHDAEHAGWPDHGVDWPGRLFLIELKTERRSHRKGQLEHYADLARHHHPDRPIDLLYLTPAMEVTGPSALPDGVTYMQISWAAISPLVAETWSGSDVDWERTVADRLAWWIGEVEAGNPLLTREAARPEPRSDLLNDGLRLAARTQEDGTQRAIESADLAPEELEALRLELRDALLDGPVIDGVEVSHVRPWLWRAATSGGTALTEAGRTTGYELRLSRYTAPQTPGAG